MPKPITNETLIGLGVCIVFFSIASVFFLNLAYTSLASNNSSFFYIPEIFALIMGLISAGMAGIGFYTGWIRKTEPTMEEKMEAAAKYKEKNKEKKKKEELESKWYFRYPIALFLLGFAWVTYKIYHDDSNLATRGIGILLFNPLVSTVVTIGALIQAWEISLIVISLGMIWLMYLGIAALPTSAAIVIGALIIALAIKYRT